MLDQAPCQASELPNQINGLGLALPALVWVTWDISRPHPWRLPCADPTLLPRFGHAAADDAVDVLGKLGGAILVTVGDGDALAVCHLAIGHLGHLQSMSTEYASSGALSRVGIAQWNQWVRPYASVW